MVPIHTDNLDKQHRAGPGPEQAGLMEAKTRLLALLYQRGICSALEVMAQWDAIVDPNVSVPCLTGGFENELEQMEADSEPLVTFIEGMENHLAAGEHKILSAADALVAEFNQLSKREERYAQRGYARISFIREGRSDVYNLPLWFSVGSGSLLEQMGRRLHEYRRDEARVSHLFEQVPVEYQRQLRAELTPFIQECLWERTWNLLDYFQFHCDITAKETLFRDNLAGMSEYNRDVYLSYVLAFTSKLRYAANAPTEEGQRRKGRHKHE